MADISKEARAQAAAPPPRFNPEIARKIKAKKLVLKRIIETAAGAAEIQNSVGAVCIARSGECHAFEHAVSRRRKTGHQGDM